VKRTGTKSNQLPVDFVPVRFTSWMGGDRDGNPNVTADITRHGQGTQFVGTLHHRQLGDQHLHIFKE
jgi:phosphoenolpyruvate carboxylase